MITLYTWYMVEELGSDASAHLFKQVRLRGVHIAYHV